MKLISECSLGEHRLRSHFQMSEVTRSSTAGLPNIMTEDSAESRVIVRPNFSDCYYSIEGYCISS